MPRIYHSASGVKTMQRCMRAAAYEYIDGMRLPNVTWQEYRAGAPLVRGQRALALGSEVHRMFEQHFRAEEFTNVDWSDEPAELFSVGRFLMPDPRACNEVHVESAIGGDPMPDGASDHAPSRCFSMAGVRWAGYIDLLARAPDEWDRLDAPHADGWVVTDYKTSSDIRRYALTSETIQSDLQACLYSAAAEERFGFPVPLRWLYMQTRGPKAVLPVIGQPTAAQAADVIGRAAEVAREFDLLERSSDAPCNTDACSDYGGCRFHRTMGGPCEARRSLGYAIQSRPKKGGKMPIDPSIKAKFQQFKKASAPTPAPEPEPEPAPTPAPTPAPEPAPEPKPKRVKKPRKPAKKDTAPEPVAAQGSIEKQIGDLSDALRAASVDRDEAQAKVDDILQQLREALG